RSSAGGAAWSRSPGRPPRARSPGSSARSPRRRAGTSRAHGSTRGGRRSADPARARRAGRRGAPRPRARARAARGAGRSPSTGADSGERAKRASTSPPVAPLYRRASARSTELSQNERVVEGELAERVVAARGAAVTGLEVDLEEQRAVVGLDRPELRDPLRGLPVHHLTVVERGAHEDRRVAPRSQVRVRAVGRRFLVVLGE